MPTNTEPESETTRRVFVGILALLALAIALSLGTVLVLLVARVGLARDPKVGVVLSLIASFVVFFGVIGLLAASYVRRPRAELMRVEGWRILSASLAVCGLAAELAYHWAASLSWLAMAFICLMKEMQSALDVGEAAAMAQRGPGYVRIGTIRGTAILAHWSIPLGGIVISAFVGFDAREAFFYGIGYLLLIVLHESGHVVAARAFGLKVHSVQISGAGGLCRTEMPTRLSHSFVFFSAGLLAQAVLLLGAMLYQGFAGVPASVSGRCLLQSFTVVNFLVIVMNVIPLNNRSGIATDGRVLWLLLRHALWGRPLPYPWLRMLPADKATVFPPETSLLSMPHLVPEGFDHGIEILNDRTTPMELVVSTLMRNLKRTREEAIQLMVAIHNTGGMLIRLPTLKEAEEVASAISAESAAAGHRLTCRAVEARHSPGALVRKS